MMHKTSKLFLLSLICVIHSASLDASQSATQQQGFFSALSADAMSLAKGAAYGVGYIAQKLGDTYLLAREYPKTTLGLAVGSALLARWVYVRDYDKNIRPIRERVFYAKSSGIDEKKGNEQVDQKFSQDWACVRWIREKVFYTKSPGIYEKRGSEQVDQKFFQDYTYARWKVKKWENPATVNRSPVGVAIAFKNDFGPLTKEVSTKLEKEIDELSKEMAILEKNYLVCKGPLGITFYDIRKDFDAIKDACADGVGEESVNFEQFKTIKKEFREMVNKKIMPYCFLAINYRNAASLWLKIKCAQLRLSAIKDYIDAIISKQANEPQRQMSDDVRDVSANLKISYDEV